MKSTFRTLVLGTLNVNEKYVIVLGTLNINEKCTFCTLVID